MKVIRPDHPEEWLDSMTVALCLQADGAMVARFNSAAGAAVGGPGHFAIFVEEDEEIVFARVSEKKSYSIRLRLEGSSSKRTPAYRMNLGIICRAAPWLKEFFGFKYPAVIRNGGLSVNLTSEFTTRIKPSDSHSHPILGDL